MDEPTMYPGPISVEDRLPENKGLVLVWVETHWFFARYYTEYDGKECRFVKDGWSFNPTHWMPMPPAPKKPPTLFRDIRMGEWFKCAGIKYLRTETLVHEGYTYNCVTDCGIHQCRVLTEEVERINP